MSQSIRQSELFAGRDWRILYTAFTQVNFNASDPSSINQALREYIAANFPEDFNDWIESSEFVAIIDLLSWLAGTLAFKIDINARENFLESAQARESILRLARFLSYNPRRNQPARGLLKLVEVTTDDDVTDATGINLSGARIRWNNPDDADWFERMSLVLNAAFVGNNPFGKPLRRGTVAGVPTQLYRLNSLISENRFGFSANVAGQGMNFEVCNGDFEDNGDFYERTPDNEAAFHMLYRNDGNGNSSPNSGFFVLFKQGELLKQTFDIDTPIENQTIDLDTSNIAENDVWVQSIDDTGASRRSWRRVPAIFSENITYNSLPADERYIYSVITRDDDRATVRFSDGLFGEAPRGRLRVWYRTGNGLQYQIRPQEIDRVTLSLRYYNRNEVVRTITLTFSLQNTVTNATQRETDEQVRQRAPAVYATQGRMVSGEDYNSYPLISNLATKLKAVNRVYSGHSRHIDLNDPTSTYQDTNVVADDGMIYWEAANSYEEVPLSFNRTTDEFVVLNVQPMLRGQNVENFVRNVMLERISTYTVMADTRWKKSTAARYSSTGYFTKANAYFKPGATLLVEQNGVRSWINIAAVDGAANVAPATGIRGPVTLDEVIADNALIVSVIPRYDAEIDEVRLASIKAKIDLNISFSLWYDPASGTWLDIEGSTAPLYPQAFKVASVEYFVDNLWKLTAQGRVYVFESARKVQWYFDGQRVVDTETGAERRDMVRVLRANSDPATGLALGRDYEFALDRMFYYRDGTVEPRRVQVKFVDNDEDGAPDFPNSFLALLPVDKKDRTLFWKRNGSAFDPISTVWVYEANMALGSEHPTSTTGNVTAISEGAVAYWLSTGLFYVRTSGEWVKAANDTYRTAEGRGNNTAQYWVTNSGMKTPARSPLLFQWKHYAPTDHRIDPAKSNLMDMFVLTSEYDYLTRQWIANGAKMADMPQAPSELDLRLAFREFNDAKVSSDEMIWRPVKYKFLFGAGSEKQNLRAQFKVVKLPGSSMPDGEIRSRVIRAINSFFSVDRWDFGSTFYYTELSAYIHQQLATIIGSCVIVPMSESASFGDLFEVQSRSDEIFVSTAQVSDVMIISHNTPANLRIR